MTLYPGFFLSFFSVPYLTMLSTISCKLSIFTMSSIACIVPRVRPSCVRCVASGGRKALPAAAKNGGPGSGRLGCTDGFFHAWTEYVFEKTGDRFSWDNRNSVWNFDHVVPQSAARKGHADHGVVHSWTNLRPYNARANSSKGSRRDEEDEACHLMLVQKFLSERVYLTEGALILPREDKRIWTPQDAEADESEFDFGTPVASEGRRRRRS